MNGTARTDADVVVVGGGGAGLAAALEAARHGARVVLLEKNPQLGGTTARSVGSITATGTPFQAASGIEDSTEAHFEDMALFARKVGLDPDTRDNLELRRLLVENVPDTMRFLMQLGVEFFGPNPEPPHRQPRMHNVLPHSRAYIYHLDRHARKAGVEIRLDARATRLLTENGRVVGVETEAAGEFRAGQGVVVAAGDYSSGREMKAAYIGPELAEVDGVNPTSTGDGQRMLREVGARIVNGDVMLGPEIRFEAPPRNTLIDALPPSKAVAKLVKASMRYMPAWLLRPFLMMFVTTNLAPSHKLFEEGAILVNNQGRRFCDETDKPQFAIPSQPGRVAYIVFDQEIAEKFAAWPYFISTAPGVAYAYLDDFRRTRPDIFNTADDLPSLAAKLSMEPDKLASAIEAHNADAPVKLATAPFHALGPAKSYVVLTDGGLAVNQSLQVLRQDDQPIAGLYAAGSAGQGGLVLKGHGHHIGWAFTSGRIAGRNAAREAVGARNTSDH